MVGVNPVTVGTDELVTVNEALLEAVPAGAVTLIGPVVAPDGTVVSILVEVDEVTVAVMPLNLTVFWLGVVLKLVP